MATIVKDLKRGNAASEGRGADPPSPPIKLSFNIAPHQVELLEDLARAQGVTKTEVIRHAIALEGFIQKELSRGAKIFVESADGKDRKELVLLGPWSSR